MPSRISSTTSAIPSTTSQTGSPSPEPQLSAPQDIVDISVNGDPNSGAPTQTNYQSYRPSTVRDQSRFDIQNGRPGTGGRYTPLHSPFETVARSTYYSRGDIAGQVNAFSGQSSAISALFSLGYEDASPNSTRASTHMDARTQQNRRIDQNLDLLQML
jgi:hypothetical protein